MFDVLGDTKGFLDTLSADLAAQAALKDTSAAAAGQFQVDMSALRAHHQELVALRDRLESKVSELGTAGAANSYPASEFVGVEESLDSTWGAVIRTGGGGESNMIDGLRALLAQITHYTNNVADTYNYYARADTTGSEVLTAAGSPAAATYTLPAGAAGAE